MKRASCLLIIACSLLYLSFDSAAATHYVNVNSRTPVFPYTTWETAATNIQDGVDAAIAGELVLVTNGAYATGGKAVYGTMTNRVAVTNALTIQSVNGPDVTSIAGLQVPGSTNGDGAIRCVYLADGAVLSGFTLTNGATRASGDWTQEQCGGGVFCASVNATVTNCVLTGNSAYDRGGGAYYGTLNDCVLSANLASSGSGACGGTLSSCSLDGNMASGTGGGTYCCTLGNCTLNGNSAGSGGGSYNDKLNNCTLTGNSSKSNGGGSYFSMLYNCALSGNTASGSGGGSYSCTLTNCTLSGNTAFLDGGGARYGTLDNCIVYYNHAPNGPNWSGATFNYCCTTPLPPRGVGNLTADPLMASTSHLSTDSPCRRAGNTACASGADIDGEPWLSPPSIGCDEYYTGSMTEALSVAVSVSHSNVATGFEVEFVGMNFGPVSASRWEFGDGTVVSNRPYASHAWVEPGDYAVVLRAYNDSNPSGVTATAMVHVVALPVHYVSLSSVSPVAPYSSWATAATNIQDAVDSASVAGALVLVTNGVYQTGGKAVDGTMTNRVAVTNALTIQSVNGPDVTSIVGRQVPGTTNGDGAIRCVYLTNGAVLSGFTLTNGATRSFGDSTQEHCGGGVLCTSVTAAITNCVLTGNSAYMRGGGACCGMLNNCTLSGNRALSGGGAYYGTLNNCTLVRNFAQNGGGSYDGTLNNCTLSGNSAKSGGGSYDGALNNCTLAGNSAQEGGGSYEGALNNCTLSGNSAARGGGSYNGTLNNCTLTGNSASWGGGSFDGRLYNCALSGNTAPRSGGGSYAGTLMNCTLTGNTAYLDGGGAYSSTLGNCIVYYNHAPDGPNWTMSTLNYCCTTPLPPSGAGNLAADPQMASASRLSVGSPCRGAGSATYVSGVDMDGEPWLNPPSIGCDEYYSGSITGALSVAIAATYTNVAAGFEVEFQGLISGQVSASRWEFGGGTVVSNRPYASHTWGEAGDYAVVLRTYNDSNPSGVTAMAMVHVVEQPVHYVSFNSVSPIAPYNSWATAATNIQDAVDSATVIGALVLVSDGVYETGGKAVYGLMTNRIAVTKALTVQSVNGPEVTSIVGRQVPGTTNGDSAIRCVYLAEGAGLSGFTLTNGATRTSGDLNREQSGGGVFCASANATVTNCILSGNSSKAYGGGAFAGTLHNCLVIGNSAEGCGGGAFMGALNNCALSGNSAYSIGGGAYSGVLSNCVLSGNSALSGGGACSSTLNNCIVYYNRAADDPNWSGGTLNYCCTTPLPPSGTGNLAADPQMASASRLSVGSPCRGAGSVAYASGVDIDGEAWLNPPSIGCDEYYSGSMTGALSVAVAALFTNVAAGFEVEFKGLISGRVSCSRWEFGDGTILSNRPYASHSWREAGDYAVGLRAYNDSNPSGVTATAMVHVVEQPVHYVSLNSVSPVAPYSTWAAAATNIQDAVDSASVAGALVLVTNGVYATGGKAVYGLMTNRVAVTKALTVQSMNGPGVTTIVGRQVPGRTNDNGAIRCAYLADGAVLSGFTLTNGATRASGDLSQEQSGGGIFCASLNATVTNCVLSGNAAKFGGGASYGTLNNCILRGNSADSYGGGAYCGTLDNCVLTRNYVNSYGGGVYSGTLNNCTLSGNSARYGGGACYGTLNNCIVYYNLAGNGSNCYGGALDYCCTTPLPSSGTNNITDAPLFVDLAGGNFHLQSGSSCINAGNNTFVPGTLDLDGNPRIVGGTVDMGAYESSVVPPIPPEFTSCRSLADGVQLQFSGEIGRIYELYGSTNLTDWVLLGTLINLSGQLLYTDPTATNHPSRFYRAVQLP